MSRVASDVYSRRLLVKGLGYPLWVPEPNNLLPAQYQDIGVRIGDVGRVTSKGSFDFLFNICLPQDHPINQGRTPDYFETIEVELSRDAERSDRQYSVGSHVACSSVKKLTVTGDLPSLQYVHMSSFFR
jgi:hypothetical protein